MQNISTVGKFHSALSEIIKRPRDGPSCYCRFSGGSIASASHIEPRVLPVFPQPFIPAQHTWKFDNVAVTASARRLAGTLPRPVALLLIATNP
jgi:hypothetical protein